MVRSSRRSSPAADTIHRPRPRRIGIIGKANLDAQEVVILNYIGRCIARLGHTLVLIPTKGTANALREGVEIEEGEVMTLDSAVIETAEHTLIYPDPQLLKRLKTKYEDIEDRRDVTIITHDDLPQWYNAIRTVVKEAGIKLPV